MSTVVSSAIKRVRLTKTDRDAYDKAERNLETFFRYSWKVLEPQTELLTNWHQGVLAEYLTACHLRQIKRLIVNMPPRYTKSNLVSVAFPAWVWARAAHERFMCFSYSAALSTKHSVDRRTLIESQWYQDGWSDRFSLAGDQNLKTSFQNDKRGHMIAGPLVGSATGLGGNALIIDDAHDATRANSIKKRETDILEFDRKIRSRLDDKTNGIMIIVMQRLHVKDLTGHVIERDGRTEDGGDWTVLELPAEAKKRTVIQLPISGKTINRPEGHVLHEERQDHEALMKERRGLGPSQYEAQYNQHPTLLEGGVIKRRHFQRYVTRPLKFDQVLISVDASFEGEQTSDSVAIETWGRIGADRYLLDVVCEKMGFWETLAAIGAAKTKWPEARKILIEKKANGHAIIQTLKRKVTGIVEVKPIGSKTERAAACEPVLESRNVWIPEFAPWVEDFIEECVAFGPGSDVDDRVDCMTQLLIYLDSKESAGDTIQKLIRF